MPRDYHVIKTDNPMKGHMLSELISTRLPKANYVSIYNYEKSLDYE